MKINKEKSLMEEKNTNSNLAQDNNIVETELDPFARKLNSPLYKLFDSLSQYVLLNLSMLLIFVFSLGFLTYASLAAATSIFIKDKKSTDGISYPKEYLHQLTQLLKDKKFLIENTIFYIELLLMGGGIALIYINMPEIILAILYTLELCIFIFMLSQLFFSAPLKHFYPQKNIFRHFLLCFVFMMHNFIYSLLLIFVSILLFILAFLIPQLTIFFIMPLIPLISCRLVQRYRNKKSTLA